LLAKKYPERKEALFGDMSRFVQPPEQIERSDSQRRAQSLDLKYRNPLKDSPSGSISAHDEASESVAKNIPIKETVDTSITTEDPDAESEAPRSESPKRQLEDISEDSKPKRRTGSQESNSSANSGERGHAHDPLEDEPLWLGIGTGESDLLSPPEDEIVAESPGAVDFNIYEKAYQQEVERIRKAQGEGALVYLTRRVESNKFSKGDKNMVEAPKDEDPVGGSQRGLKDALEPVRRKEQKSPVTTVKTTLSGVAKQVGSDIRDKGNTALASTLHKMTFSGGEEEEQQERLKERNV
jgi:[calcium/calmodulin-dependent protein kinase] kinase